MKHETKQPLLLYSSSNGIDIGKLLGSDISSGAIICTNKDKFTQELKDLTDTDNEFYLDAWSTIEENAIIEDDNGNKYFLYPCEGDLFAVPEGFNLENWEQNDLFDHPELIPDNVKEVLDSEGWGESYADCQRLKEKLNVIGYDIDYYLDAIPYNLRPVQNHQ